MIDPHPSPERTSPPEGPFAQLPSWAFAVRVAAVIAVVTAASYLAPTAHSATVVGMIFLAATYLFVWRSRRVVPGEYGLALGGLFDVERLDPRRLAVESLRAIAWGLLAFVVVAVPFYYGFRFYHHLSRPFMWAAVAPSFDEAMGHLLVIAFPEEAFFRGYVQTELTRRLEDRRVAGAAWIAIVGTSAIFALAHLLTRLDPARLAVFFPSLAFGLLRKQTRGVGAGTVFHALCNLLSNAVQRGFGLG